MFRFSIKDIMWLTVVVAMAICWGGSVEAWRSERAGHQVAKAALNAEEAHSALLGRQLADTKLRLSRITSAYVQIKRDHEKAQRDLVLVHQQEMSQLRLHIENELKAAKASYQERGELDEPGTGSSRGR